ncbi:hypothetical protein B0H11DRAFT_1626196, partial [Mycena galericulata]
LQVLYFNVYGTLVDHETGILTALQPLLVRCASRLDGSEALSFYFESELEVKRRIPTANYLEVLARSHEDMAMRLGLDVSDHASSLFASSIFDWPLFHDAVQCLQNLRPWVPLIIALFDVDHETLTKTSSFSVLAPYFAEVFTWDASHTYPPDFDALDPPFLYHDDLGIPREHRCLVSNSVFRELEPASEFEIPTIWLRYSGSLAGN